MAAVVQKWTSGQAREAAAAIVRALRDKGFTAHFAGGCVRDELLGLEPIDFDVATDARPDAVQALFRRTAAVGASFGVVLVKERGVTVEVASFRSDGPYTDKRRPDHVEFSDAEHDAQRRDFTINALFLDPFHGGPALRAGRASSGSESRTTTTGSESRTTESGSESRTTSESGVLDFVGGLTDLRAGVVRAVGDPEKRLAEDHLRALRAIRFAARYGFEIEPGTASAIRAHARDLQGVSRERIGEEFRRMLGDPGRTRAVALLGELGLDSVVLGVSGCGPRGGWLAALGGRDGAPGPTFASALACLAFDRGAIGSAAQVPALVRRWRAALCLTNEESDRLRAVLAGVIDLTEAGGRSWCGLPLAQRKRRAASAWFAEGLAVVGAGDPALGAAIAAEVASMASDGVGLAPEPMIDGNDLLALPLQPGPVFARVLAAVYDAQLEGRVRSKDQATAMARELGSPGGV